MAAGRWQRPAPSRTREKLLEAEGRRDYESAALLAIACCDQLEAADASYGLHAVLMQQAQVYATLCLATATEAAAEQCKQQGQEPQEPQTQQRPQPPLR
ncbi:hypothetical protein H7J07_04890 [Mycobacterium koreense]|uniref:Uncharacterized protein n=1 Tax=Mycolicibacillus koreensis TaxID=1069220 RepID=A0A7I7SAQ0_9MYCO|nr:hypothetical protein [Mycolicibacillus koreensis]MCV7247594.1 hypothetical protein [Mycolicibacillus koreensis]OSC32830.1 hypothetical protein B8W67_14010 [Mycolicibacillus koreensis]BBY53972.1 hypothetical protein MKOR_12230 [Mycolicibacillus koreensis]